MVLLSCTFIMELHAGEHKQWRDVSRVVAPNKKRTPWPGVSSHYFTAWATTPVRVTQILGPETVQHKNVGGGKRFPVNLSPCSSRRCKSDRQPSCRMQSSLAAYLSQGAATNR